MSWRAEFQTERGGEYASNALRFATEAEARQYGADLFARWTAAIDWRTAPSDDPVRDAIVDGAPRARGRPAVSSRKLSSGMVRLRRTRSSAALTVPSHIARSLPPEMSFNCEITEEGLLFRPSSVASELPSWLSDTATRPTGEEQ